MKLTHKTLGLSVIALAAGLFASATLADNAPAKGLAAADADGDGKVTQSEFEAWRAAKVTALDADKDGKISAEELAAERIKAVTEEAQRMVDRLDTDKDGKLSAAELAAMPVPGFDRLDHNGDGVLDQAELAQARDMGGPGRHHGHQKGMQDDMAPPDGAPMDPAGN